MSKKMTEQEVINTVRTIIANKFYKHPDDIDLATSFTQGLGADSLGMLELAMEISTRFKIPSTDLEIQDTVDDVVTLICKHLKISRSTNKGASNIIALITVIGQKRQNLQKFAKYRTK